MEAVDRVRGSRMLVAGQSNLNASVSKNAQATRASLVDSLLSSMDVCENGIRMQLCRDRQNILRLRR